MPPAVVIAVRRSSSSTPKERPRRGAATGERQDQERVRIVIRDHERAVPAIAAALVRSVSAWALPAESRSRRARGSRLLASVMRRKMVGRRRRTLRALGEPIPRHAAASRRRTRGSVQWHDFARGNVVRLRRIRCEAVQSARPMLRQMQGLQYAVVKILAQTLGVALRRRFRLVHKRHVQPQYSGGKRP